MIAELQLQNVMNSKSKKQCSLPDREEEEPTEHIEDRQ